MSSIAKMCVMSMDETSLNPHLFHKCSKDMVIVLEAKDLKTYTGKKHLEENVCRHLKNNYIVLGSPRRCLVEPC